MQYSPERVDIEYFKHFNENVYDKMDVPLGLNLGSVLGNIRNITSVIGMSYLMYDEDEDLFADIVDTYADMQYKCAEAILETGAKFDFAHYWENICFNSGPLLSPDIFNELCAKHYKKRNALCHKYGIDVISLDCDGVTEKLLPTWFENGVNKSVPGVNAYCIPALDLGSVVDNFFYRHISSDSVCRDCCFCRYGSCFRSVRRLFIILFRAP